MSKGKKKDRQRQQFRNRQQIKQRAETRKKLVEGLGLGEGMTVIRGHGEKMSDVLMDFLEPYEQEWQTIQELTTLLQIGVIAWNTALMPEAERDDSIRKVLDPMPPDVQAAFLSIIVPLVARKETHFARNRRAILNFTVTPTPDGPHIDVLSTLGKD